MIIFEIKNEFFQNGSAKIRIPEKEQDLKTQVESLTKIVSEMRKAKPNIKLLILTKMKLLKNLSSKCRF